MANTIPAKKLNNITLDEITARIGLNGNASTSSKLFSPRNITLTGDVTGSVSFDGSQNVTIPVTITDDSHNHTISNVDGLQTALDGKLSTTGKAADSDKLDGLDSSDFTRGSHASYSSVDIDNGIDDWYTIFTMRDNDTTPVICNIRAYAHTAVSFVVSKGYLTGQQAINVLQATGGGNSSFKYVKAIRIVGEGIVQVKLNGGANVGIEVNVIGTFNLDLPSTLNIDTTTLPENVYDEVNILDGMIRAKGEIYSNSNKVFHAANANVSTVDWTANKFIGNEAQIDSVNINGNGISTTSGSLLLDSAANLIDINADVDIQSNLTIGGAIYGSSEMVIDPTPTNDVAGKLIIKGDLQVDGTTTTINSTTVEVQDKNIVLAKGSTNKTAANGAGISIDLGTDGTADFTYNSSLDDFVINKALKIDAAETGALKVNNSSSTVASISTDNTYLQLGAANYIQIVKPLVMSNTAFMFQNESPFMFDESDGSWFNGIQFDKTENKLRIGSVTNISAGGDTAFYVNTVEKARVTSTGFNVGGNITLDGTVDGRDIAVDGIKLDDIGTFADFESAFDLAYA